MDEQQKYFGFDVGSSHEEKQAARAQFEWYLENCSRDLLNYESTTPQILTP